MRSVAVMVGGLLAAGAAYALSEALTGLPGATAFMLALLLVPVTLGISVSQAYDSWDKRPAALRKLRMPGRKPRCLDCATTKIRTAGVTLCPNCDMLVSTTGIGGDWREARDVNG